MNRSKRANHYGTICEKRAFKKYGLTPARASWKDAEFKNGKPVEIKSTMLVHADGNPGTFKLYDTAHSRLRRMDGSYAFVVYRTPDSDRVDVVKTKLIHSSRLPRLSWHGGGSHRDMRQAKVGISEIF